MAALNAAMLCHSCWLDTQPRQSISRPAILQLQLALASSASVASLQIYDPIVGNQQVGIDFAFLASILAKRRLGDLN
jgi:hypothetical protein